MFIPWNTIVNHFLSKLSFSQVGGILGLCVGVSLISAVEIVYWWAKRYLRWQFLNARTVYSYSNILMYLVNVLAFLVHSTYKMVKITSGWLLDWQSELSNNRRRKRRRRKRLTKKWNENFFKEKSSFWAFLTIVPLP